MFRSLWTRGMYALIALALLLSTTVASAQNDIGFIEAPAAVEASSPAELVAPTDAQRIGESPESLEPGTLDSDTLDPETLHIDESELDYTFDKSTVKSTIGHSSGCDSCDGCDGCDHCGCNHRGRFDLFGKLHLMMARSHADKHGPCGGSHDSCIGKPMTCAEGSKHDPNRTVAPSGELFRQYYTQGPAAIPAQMYISPYPVPAAVGHTYITYQAFEPHQFMYRHKRAYTRRHGPSGGTTTTRIYWW